MKGSGTTCPFVADVATQAVERAAGARDRTFQMKITSAATQKTYQVSCTVQEYIECSLPGSQGGSLTYVYVMRG